MMKKEGTKRSDEQVRRAKGIYRESVGLRVGAEGAWKTWYYFNSLIKLMQFICMIFFENIIKYVLYDFYYEHQNNHTPHC